MRAQSAHRFFMRLVPALCCAVSLGACEFASDPRPQRTTLAIDVPQTVFGGEAFAVGVEGMEPGDTLALHVLSRGDHPSRLRHGVLQFAVSAGGRIDTRTDTPAGFDSPSIRRVFWRRTLVPRREAPFQALRDEIDWPARHWLIVAETSRATGWAMVKVAPVEDHPDLEIHPIDAAGMAGWRFAPANAPGPLLILLGGSDGAQDWEHARALADRGFTAVTLRWRGSMAPGSCLGRLDYHALEAAIDAVRDAYAAQGAGFGLFGFSQGQELALFHAAHAAEKPDFIAVASGWDTLGHGEGGPFCLFPDALLLVDGDPAPQINHWGAGPLALWRFLAARGGLVTQADAGRAALDRTPAERIAPARLGPPGPGTTFLAAAGGRDTLVPAVEAARKLCEGRPQDCLVFAEAEHTLVWTGVAPMGCDWMGEETCEATGKAQALLVEAITERAYAALGVPGGFATPYAPGQAPDALKP